MRQAVQAHGIGTLSDLRDYFRMKRAEAEPALAELVRTGEVEGGGSDWNQWRTIESAGLLTTSVAPHGPPDATCTAQRSIRW